MARKPQARRRPGDLAAGACLRRKRISASDNRQMQYQAGLRGGGFAPAQYLQIQVSHLSGHDSVVVL